MIELVEGRSFLFLAELYDCLMAGQAWGRVFLQERLLVVVGSETRLFIWGFIP